MAKAKKKTSRKKAAKKPVKKKTAKKLSTGDALRHVRIDAQCLHGPIIAGLLAVGCTTRFSGVVLTDEAITNLDLHEGVHFRDVHGAGPLFNPNLVPPENLREMADKLDVNFKYSPAWGQIFPR